MTNEQLIEIEKDAVRRDESTAQILMLVAAVREAHRAIAAVLDNAALAEWACYGHSYITVDGGSIESLCRRTIGREG